MGAPCTPNLMSFVEWQHLSSMDNDPKMSKKKRDKGAPAVAIKIFRRKGTWCTSPAVAIEYSEAREGGAGRREVKEHCLG